MGKEWWSMCADATRSYPVHLDPVTEKFLGCWPEYTRSDHKPCQVHVQTTARRDVVLSPGSSGDAFPDLWDRALRANAEDADVADKQALLDALPELTPVQRLEAVVVVAAPRE